MLNSNHNYHKHDVFRQNNTLTHALTHTQVKNVIHVVFMLESFNNGIRTKCTGNPSSIFEQWQRGNYLKCTKENGKVKKTLNAFVVNTLG